ncbi:FecR family protein [Hallella colorans]|uniref:FecR family protein n=1 Tax=Hallella colorans TaxID=1703337 RepID=UPI0023F55DEA|nr:FecR family protein [Hallella colorans]
MIKNNKTEIKLDQKEEEQLAYECEDAFLRLKYAKPNVIAAWEQQKLRMHPTDEKKSLRGLNAMGKYVAVAAAVIVFIVICVLAYTHQDSQKQMIMQATLMKPTQNTEFLLEEIGMNGKVSESTKLVDSVERRKLTNGAVVSSQLADYTNVMREATNVNIVSIPGDQTYKIILSDGTEVYLNTNSRFVYPTCFRGRERVVYLYGEAYFKVSKDKRHPFIIMTDRTKTSVLGTELNIKSYKTEEHVTLVKGLIKVEIPEMKREIQVSPGTDLSYSDKKISIRNVDTTIFTLWKDGYFYFDEKPLQEVLDELAHWYHVSVQFEDNPQLKQMKLHFISNRNEKLENVVESLNNFNSFTVSLVSDKLIVREKRNR